MVGRKRKYSNPNPIPRKNLPDVEKVIKDLEPIFRKVTGDIIKNWWWQINIPEIEKEVRQTILLAFSIEWDAYRKGIIDNFPPTSAYLYVRTWWLMHRQFAPENDLIRHNMLTTYCTLEIPDIKRTGNIIATGSYNPIRGNKYDIAIKSDDFDDEKPGNGLPDLLDLWYLGLSINQLAVIYNMCPLTVRNRLHHYYDAIEILKEKGILKEPIMRERPRRRKRKINRFKKKPLKNNVSA